MSLPKESFYADSMAFFALPGQPPKFALGSRPRLKLAQLTSCPPFISDFNQALSAHDNFRKEILSNPNVHEVRSREDLNKGIASIGVLFGMQKAPALLTLADIWALKHHGVKFMSLAYDVATEYGGGFLSESTDDRLTTRGKKVLEWMAKAGITLDLSHVGNVTMLEAVNYIKQRNLPIWVVATHSGCYSVCPHARNMSDEILKSNAIDYFGVPGISFYLGPKGSSPLVNFARHLEFAVSAMGKGKVGIGSDCPHISMTMEEAEMQFKRMQEMLKTGGTFGEYFPDRPLELIWHGANMFKVIEHSPHLELVLKSDPGVLGLNFRDFLDLSLPPVV